MRKIIAMTSNQMKLVRKLNEVAQEVMRQLLAHSDESYGMTIESLTRETTKLGDEWRSWDSRGITITLEFYED